MRVEVAVLMFPFGFDVPPHVQGLSGVDVPWQERSRCTIELHAEATVGQALDAAAAFLGITVLPEAGGGGVSTAVAGVAFDGPVDESKLPARMFYPVVTADGAVVWNLPVVTVSFNQLAATAAMGLFDGDPHRVYLVPQVAAGWPGEVDWQTCLAVASALAAGLTHLDGVVGGAERVKSVLAHLVGVVRARADAWTQRGGGLHDVAEVTAKAGGDVDLLATLLEVTPREARLLAEALAPQQLGPSPLTEDQKRLADVARWSLFAAVESGLLFHEGGPGMLPALIEEALHASRNTDVVPDDIARIFFGAMNPHQGSESSEAWVPPS